MTISSARTVSVAPQELRARGNSCEGNLARPSERDQWSSTPAGPPAVGPDPAARPRSVCLPVEGHRRPVWASKTATPTGEVSMRVSRSALARRSSRCVRALAMTSAAWDANIARISSSARVNSSPSSLSPTKTWPTRAPVEHGRSHEGKTPTGRGMLKSVNPRPRTCSARSGTLRGSEMLVRASNIRQLSGVSHSRSASSVVIPDARKSCTPPASSSRVITP